MAQLLNCAAPGDRAVRRVDLCSVLDRCCDRQQLDAVGRDGADGVCPVTRRRLAE